MLLALPQLSSNFECDTAGGFAWLKLNASLATLSGGGGGVLQRAGGQRAPPRLRPAVAAARTRLVLTQRRPAAPPAGAATVLNSTCQDLNTTGCCTQAPPGNLTWASYGLGGPQVVQGVRLVAPSGECCVGGDCAVNGSGPCTDRFLNTYLIVANASAGDM